MSLLERYIGHYVQLTMDPDSLPFTVDLKEDGPVCYVGKVAKVDSHFALLDPCEIFRPEDEFTRNNTLTHLVQYLQKYEARQGPNVVELSDRTEPEVPAGLDFVKPEDTAEGIRRRVHQALAPNERLVPLASIRHVELYKE